MKISHVHLKVNHLEQAKYFYTELLGLKITEELEGNYVFMSLGHAHHDLALQKTNSNINSGSLYHVAYEVDNTKDLYNMAIKLKNLQLPFAMINHGISWAIYTRDPESNGIEIFLDRRNSTNGKKEWKGISTDLTIEEIKAAI